MTPDPWQIAQTSGTVPAFAPVPRQALQAHGGALDGLGEADGHVALDVGPATLGARRAASGRLTGLAEEPTEDVAQTTVGLRIAEQVLDVDAARRPGCSPAREAETPTAEETASLVVLLALGHVGEHRVGLRGLLEALLGSLVTGVLVGVVLASDLAEGLLDLVGLRVLGDAENLVVVLLEVILLTHSVSSLLLSCCRLRDRDRSRRHAPDG